MRCCCAASGLACLLLMLGACEGARHDVPGAVQGAGGVLAGGAGVAGNVAPTDVPMPEYPPRCETFEDIDSICPGFGSCDDSGGGVGCDASFANPMPAATVLLLVDKGDSMADAGVYPSASPWHVLTQGLATALSDPVLLGNTSVGLGLLLFPEADVAGSCEDPACCSVSSDGIVDIEPTSDAGPLVVEALEAASPGGRTPTAAALGLALEYFATHEVAPDLHQTLGGSRYVLLVTDGGPDCGSGADCEPDQEPLSCLDAEATLAEIQALGEAGIQTIVVGLPGSESYAEWFARFAEAGRTAQSDLPSTYYAVSAEGGMAEIGSTFAGILRGIARPCRFPGYGVPLFFSELLANVAIDCTFIPKARVPGTGSVAQSESSWFLDVGASPPWWFVIQGPWCDKLETEAHRVDMIVGCPPLL